jgi:hypothetical protein
MNKFIFGLVLIILLTACGVVPASPANATISPGIPVSFSNISLVIPEGLASGASFTTSTNVEYPYINASFGEMPTHNIILLGGYPIADRSAYILVFKADEYAAYTDETAEVIASLQVLPNQLAEPYSPALVADFSTQVRTFSTANNQGLRFLTEIQTGYAPVSNAGLFYFYQGLTLDGLYYIEAICPVNAAFLQDDYSLTADVPANGVPFPPTDSGDTSAFQTYKAAVTDKLNSATADFTPALLLIDELVGSIQFEP